MRPEGGLSTASLVLALGEGDINLVREYIASLQQDQVDGLLEDFKLSLGCEGHAEGCNEPEVAAPDMLRVLLAATRTREAGARAVLEAVAEGEARGRAGMHCMAEVRMLLVGRSDSQFTSEQLEGLTLICLEATTTPSLSSASSSSHLLLLLDIMPALLTAWCEWKDHDKEKSNLSNLQLVERVWDKLLNHPWRPEAALPLLSFCCEAAPVLQLRQRWHWSQVIQRLKDCVMAGGVEAPDYAGLLRQTLMLSEALMGDTDAEESEDVGWLSCVRLLYHHAQPSALPTIELVMEQTLGQTACVAEALEKELLQQPSHSWQDVNLLLLLLRQSSPIVLCSQLVLPSSLQRGTHAEGLLKTLLSDRDHQSQTHSAQYSCNGVRQLLWEALTCDGALLGAEAVAASSCDRRSDSESLRCDGSLASVRADVSQRASQLLDLAIRWMGQTRDSQGGTSKRGLKRGRSQPSTAQPSAAAMAGKDARSCVAIHIVVVVFKVVKEARPKAVRSLVAGMLDKSLHEPVRQSFLLAWEALMEEEAKVNFSSLQHHSQVLSDSLSQLSLLEPDTSKRVLLSALPLARASGSFLTSLTNLCRKCIMEVGIQGRQLGLAALCAMLTAGDSVNITSESESVCAGVALERDQLVVAERQSGLLSVLDAALKSGLPLALRASTYRALANGVAGIQADLMPQLTGILQARLQRYFAGWEEVICDSGSKKRVCPRFSSKWVLVPLKLLEGWSSGLGPAGAIPRDALPQLVQCVWSLQHHSKGAAVQGTARAALASAVLTGFIPQKGSGLEPQPALDLTEGLVRFLSSGAKVTHVKLSISHSDTEGGSHTLPEGGSHTLPQCSANEVGSLQRLGVGHMAAQALLACLLGGCQAEGKEQEGVLEASWQAFAVLAVLAKVGIELGKAKGKKWKQGQCACLVDFAMFGVHGLELGLDLQSEGGCSGRLPTAIGLEEATELIRLFLESDWPVSDLGQEQSLWPELGLWMGLACCLRVVSSSSTMETETMVLMLLKVRLSSVKEVGPAATLEEDGIREHVQQAVDRSRYEQGGEEGAPQQPLFSSFLSALPDCWRTLLGCDDVDVGLTLQGATADLLYLAQLHVLQAIAVILRCTLPDKSSSSSSSNSNINSSDNNAWEEAAVAELGGGCARAREWLCCYFAGMLKEGLKEGLPVKVVHAHLDVIAVLGEHTEFADAEWGGHCSRAPGAILLDILGCFTVESVTLFRRIIQLGFKLGGESARLGRASSLLKICLSWASTQSKDGNDEVTSADEADIGEGADDDDEDDDSRGSTSPRPIRIANALTCHCALRVVLTEYDAAVAVGAGVADVMAGLQGLFEGRVPNLPDALLAKAIGLLERTYVLIRSAATEVAGAVSDVTLSVRARLGPGSLPSSLAVLQAATGAGGRGMTETLRRCIAERRSGQGSTSVSRMAQLEFKVEKGLLAVAWALTQATRALRELEQEGVDEEDEDEGGNECQAAEETEVGDSRLEQLTFKQSIERILKEAQWILEGESHQQASARSGGREKGESPNPAASRVQQLGSRRGRRRKRIRSRNAAIDAWLEEDVGGGGTAPGEDAFVDLEDFLVANEGLGASP